jgi:peptidoglycan/LPS O-acetylase OafA/YrhL
MAKRITAKKERESGLELLRLVCMLFILFHHFILNGLGSASYGKLATVEGITLNSFVCVAVNCFVLISGYFGIKAGWKGFFRLYIMCSFYFFTFGLLDMYFNGLSIQIFLYGTFMPFICPYGLWFVKCYFLLYLLSPILNYLLAFVNKRQFILLLILGGIFEFFFGYLWKGSIGYDVGHLIFLYFIGRFVYLYIIDNKHILLSRRGYFGLYILCSLAIAGMGILILKLSNVYTMISLCYPYNSPLIVISAIAFFLLFRSFRFRNKAVNWLAASAFAVYLIHENLFMRVFYVDYVNELAQTLDNGFLLAACLAMLAFVILIACILIDKFRMFITNPIERLFNKIDWDGYTNRLVDKIAEKIE